MIRIEMPDRVANGDHLTGRAVWTSSGGDPARTFQVVCGWRIEGRAGKHESIVDRVALDDVSGSEVALPFDFQMPLEGPLSYEGKLFRVVWEVNAATEREIEAKVLTVVARPFNREDWIEPDEEEDEGQDVT